MKTLKLYNGKKIQQQEPYIILQTDGSPKPELHTARGFLKGRKWSKEVKLFDINVLELLALKFAILTFTKNLSHLTIHIEVDNKVALAYLLKMGGTRNPQLLKISQTIQNYLLSHQIIITAQYLSSSLNARKDWDSKNATDSSNWKPLQKVYLKITKVFPEQYICLPPGCVTNFTNVWHGSQIRAVSQQMQSSRTGTKCLVLHSHPVV